ncbi:hypothetical protein [Lactococcus allomyrinae]|uniref:Head-tail adaptor protein n=1 Tax=Lactococcus allomyrinae TaxID=2419773 RepID=A0A387BKG8_9LACT|nr:hypothetical protein [Lactococcus allomyrinae]AYG01709.1 hypothetical protein D7I46_11980 [Lactococcus allomyrinae]
MLYRETLKFYKSSVYDEKTGNFKLGESFNIENLDVRVYRGEDTNQSEKGVVNSKQIISVRSRESFPLNHIVEWNSKRWKIRTSNFTSYEDKRRRHWFSARFIEVGDV